MEQCKFPPKGRDKEPGVGVGVCGGGWGVKERQKTGWGDEENDVPLGKRRFRVCRYLKDNTWRLRGPSHLWEGQEPAPQERFPPWTSLRGCSARSARLRVYCGALPQLRKSPFQELTLRKDTWRVRTRIKKDVKSVCGKRMTQSTEFTEIETSASRPIIHPRDVACWYAPWRTLQGMLGIIVGLPKPRPRWRQFRASVLCLVGRRHPYQLHVPAMVSTRARPPPQRFPSDFTSCYEPLWPFK